MVQLSNMKVSIDDAKDQLDELVRLAEAGEEVILTREGLDVVQMIPVEHESIPSVGAITAKP